MDRPRAYSSSTTHGEKTYTTSKIQPGRLQIRARSPVDRKHLRRAQLYPHSIKADLGRHNFHDRYEIHLQVADSKFEKGKPFLWSVRK